MLPATTESKLVQVAKNMAAYHVSVDDPQWSVEGCQGCRCATHQWLQASKLERLMAVVVAASEEKSGA